MAEVISRRADRLSTVIKEIAPKLSAVLGLWHEDTTFKAIAVPAEEDKYLPNYKHLRFYPTTYQGKVEHQFINPDGSPKPLLVSDFNVDWHTIKYEEPACNDSFPWSLVVSSDTAADGFASYYIFRDMTLQNTKYPLVISPYRRGQNTEATNIEGTVDSLPDSLFIQDQTHHCYYRIIGTGLPLYAVCDEFEIAFVDASAQERKLVSVTDVADFLLEYGIDKEQYTQFIDPAEADHAEVAEQLQCLIDDKTYDMEDPYIDSSELCGQDVAWNHGGSQELLDKHITAILQALVPYEVWDKDPETTLTIYCSDEDDAANVPEEEWANPGAVAQYACINLMCHLQAAVDTSPPSGYDWEYNDGAYDRMSGYSRSRLQHHVVVTKPSAHERLRALKEAKAFCEEKGLSLPKHLTQTT